jgi:tRNA(Ile)-lysidine synthase
MAKITLEKFLSCLKVNNLINEGEKCILAVSGGVDSMVMTDLFVRAEIPVVAAHIHHNLRGNDADEDAGCVRDYCNKHQIIFEQYTIPKKSLLKKNLQEEARKIRYAFLNRLLKDYQYDKIATAHHNDDFIETFFMHLLRGSGLKGLSSIPEQNGLIIRPMLNFTKSEIYDYAVEHNIPFREDHTNFEDHYLRNRIRQKLMPVLSDTEPAFPSKITESIGYIKESQELLSDLIDELIRKHSYRDGDNLIFNIKALLEYKSHKTLLFNILNPYGFNLSQIQQLCTESQTGSAVHSESYKLWKNRDQIILTALPEKEQVASLFFIENDHISTEIGTFVLEYIDGTPSFYEADVLYLDAHKVGTSYRVRLWQKGDKMTPLGMVGKSQKVKDLLTGIKIPVHQKSSVPVLECEDEIAAVIPFRISENFKCTSTTKRTLIIRRAQTSLF